MLRIRELRKIKKISQQTLANYLGITQATLSGWETGKYEIDNESLSKIADYFHITTDYLLGRENLNIEKDSDLELDDIQYALYGEIKELSDEDKKKILEFAKFVKEQAKK